MIKGVDERIDEGVLQRFRHAERINHDKFINRVNRREYAGSRSVGRLWKRWIDTVKECLRNSFRCQARKENGAG